LTEDGTDGGRPPRASAPLLRRLAVAGVLIVFLTTGAVATAALLRIKTFAYDVVPPSSRVHIDEGVIAPAKPGKPQTILLVGSDKRFGAGKGDARSDTMMLVRLDPDQIATTVMSIPRDLVTDIPGHGRGKINGAYALGGLNLTLKTVKALLGGHDATTGAPGKPFEINHAIGVNFSGFRRVVNFVGCVYTDVDRRYFHSNAGLPPAAQYAEIDVQPGYQRLCGQRALDYVRFRHADSDFVRAARQQAFLRAAKSQIGTSRLVKDIDPLAKIIGRSTEADANLGSTTGILRIMKLALFSATHPVQEVDFPGEIVNDPQASYVTATPQGIADAVQAFLHPTRPAAKPAAPRPAPAAGTTKPKKRRPGTARTYAAYGLIVARRLGEDLVAPLAAKGQPGFPLYFPKAMTSSARYPTATKDAPQPRVYTLRDRADRPHRAYRIVAVENELEGQYYGIQGTTWKNPPILDGAFEPLRMRGRTYEQRFDGKHVRTIAWRTPRATYWVSNTLSLDLTNNQMRGLARSLDRLGAP
jgi:LCP family protein required for cell wall assembly